jgi:hypothetical protein
MSIRTPAFFQRLAIVNWASAWLRSAPSGVELEGRPALP